ncbi:MAG: hypothetical protein MUE94_11720 [Verrucomicrobia bacterium]|jgi:DNA-binding NarL/FixJ family response regulator|nr:hypothetical protein [Verrucomicrobiota bacterium]
MNRQRILISTCEDDIFRSAEVIAGHHLESRGGVEIAQAKHRDECEQLATSGNFDLIVLLGQTTLYSRGFVGSPLDNSIAIIKAIKAKVATPVLALSTMPEEEGALLNAGAHGFLAMPYTLDEFTGALNRLPQRP